ncbi:MAG: hypothetical protein AABZ47_16730 [Planctomycetota bacterium]
MFRVEDMRERLDKRPFEPFRICLTDGRTYDVNHPDLCMLGRTTVHVGVPESKVKRLVMRIDQCALVHIVRIEPINGHAKRGASKTHRKSG